MAPDGVTAMLAKLRSGDKESENALFALVYNDLHQLATRRMRDERHGHTLQTTALVHEVYLRLVRQHEVQFSTRVHFFAVAARTMRRILVDHARAHVAAKRGGKRFMTSLDECAAIAAEPSSDMMALDDAMKRLAVFDSRQAEIVEMRFFGGMSEEEIAEVLGISPRTVKRDWRLARAWLYGELRP